MQAMRHQLQHLGSNRILLQTVKGLLQTRLNYHKAFFRLFQPAPKARSAENGLKRQGNAYQEGKKSLPAQSSLLTLSRGPFPQPSPADRRSRLSPAAPRFPAFADFWRGAAAQASIHLGHLALKHPSPQRAYDKEAEGSDQNGRFAQ